MHATKLIKIDDTHCLKNLNVHLVYTIEFNDNCAFISNTCCVYFLVSILYKYNIVQILIVTNTVI